MTLKGYTWLTLLIFLSVKAGEFQTCTDLLGLRELSTGSFIHAFDIIETLEGIQSARNLEIVALHLTFAPPSVTVANTINDLTPLKNLVKLKVLYLKTHGIKDLSPLSNLENLESLSLMDNFITDLSPLAQLDKLRILQLSGNPIEDISSLKDLTDLEALGLGDTYLTRLYQHPQPNLDNDDISIVADFKALKSLDLSGNPIDNFAPIQYLNRLESLNLSHTGFRDVKLLEGFLELKTLLLQEIELKSVKSLTGLTHLALLRLDDNYIQDLRPLEQNPGIGTGDTITLDGNCLYLSSDSEASRIIAELESKGVTVTVGNQRPADECSK